MKTITFDEISKISGGKEEIYVVSAFYGIAAKSCFCNAIAAVSNACNNQTVCVIPVNNELCEDPCPGYQKELDVLYKCASRSKATEASENDKAILYC